MSRIEAKKHGVKQLQGNDWIVTLVVSNEDFHVWGIAQDGMGAIYTMDVISSEEEAFKADYSPVISKMESADDIPSNCDSINHIATNAVASEQTEGDNLRIRAVMHCKERQFQDYCADNYIIAASEIIECSKKNSCGLDEARCIKIIYAECAIKSRSELTTNIEAQAKFKRLLAKFDSWKLENQYPDNIGRL